MRIEVLPEDILKGVPDTEFLCPVSRAIKRCTGMEWVSTDYRQICLADHTPVDDEDPNVKVIETGGQLGKIILDYDFTGYMAPFGFEL